MFIWDPSVANFSSFMIGAGLMIEGYFLGYSHSLRIVNIYGPYNQKQDFWDRVKASGILNYHKIIMGEDLNFTLSAEEIWGTGRFSDPLRDNFRAYLENEGLNDIILVVLTPTWSNGRLGQVGIAKCLDRFFYERFIV